MFASRKLSVSLFIYNKLQLFQVTKPYQVSLYYKAEYLLRVYLPYISFKKNPVDSIFIHNYEDTYKLLASSIFFNNVFCFIEFYAALIK